jgi:excinuclease ABC subunit A
VAGSFETTLNPVQKQIAGELLKEIRARRRLPAERRVALPEPGSLRPDTLRRRSPAHPARRPDRFSGLVGVLYILDEPSIGLHPRDNQRLLNSILRLRDIGNTVLVVEHDEDTMRAADYLVDFGPGPGVRGGEIVAAGLPADVFANPNSPTGQYLTGAKTIPFRPNAATATARRSASSGRHNNLKDVTVDIPARQVHGRHRRQRVGEEFAGE